MGKQFRVMGRNDNTSQDNTKKPATSQTENKKPDNGTPDFTTSPDVSDDKPEKNTKILVAYFSCTGTTKKLAEYAAETVGGELYEIVPENPYTEEDLAYYTNGRADQEQNDSTVRPAILGNVQNMDVYDTVILGYPIWHGQAPRIISTFLESYDFSGKTIIPFCTSHSSGIGSSASNLSLLCSKSAMWKAGKRFDSTTSKELMENWLEEIL